MKAESKIYRLLLVDDDKAWSLNLKDELEILDFEVRYEERAENALAQIRRYRPDVVLLDVMFQHENKGKPTFDKIKGNYPSLPVIILTSTMVDTYDDADYPGRAFPYPKDSLKPDDEKSYISFANKIRRAIERVAEVENYKERFLQLGFVVGNTGVMKEVSRIILKAAESNSNVLITGELGTGKELVAKAIHSLRERIDNPFVTVNCGAIADSLIEAELFGVCAKTATEVREKEGYFEQADKGTVFLDEIGTMPLNHQAKILRVLEERRISRVGGSPNCECKNRAHRDHTAINLDLRIIAATNLDIISAVKDRKFREDLFYRLNVIGIHLPSLRERKEDIEELYKYFIRVLNKIIGKEIEDILRPDLKLMLESYDWPGNIRELRAAIERAMNITDSTILLKSDFSLAADNKNEELLFDPNVVIDRFTRGEINFTDIKKRIAPMKSPSMRAILEGICRQCYERNGIVSEVLLVPILKLNTRANVHRVLKVNGISTTELNEKFKRMSQA